MTAKLAAVLFVASSVLAPAAAYGWGTNAGAATSESKTANAKGSVSDAAITTKVKAALAKDNQVSARNIHVETNNGVVKLTGTAKSQDEADKAVSLAKNANGVTSVDNQIKVSTSTAKY